MAASLNDIATTQQRFVQSLWTLAITLEKLFPRYGKWTQHPLTTPTTGTQGQAAYDNGDFYVCVEANTWKRLDLVGSGAQLVTQDDDDFITQSGDFLITEGPTW